MKKRAFALALCLCMVLSWVPVTVRAAVDASDAQTYLDILARETPTNSYLIDFDGDGRDELLTVRIKDAFDVTYSIYQGNQAVLVNEAAAGVGVANLDITHVVSYGGKFYICNSDYVYSTLQNGRWVITDGMFLYGTPVAGYGSDPTFSDEDLAAIEYLVDGKKVSEEEYNRLRTRFQFQFPLYDAYGEYDAIDYRAKYTGDVTAQLEAMVSGGSSAGTTAGSLGGVSYFGDRSKCRMTAEMAAAYRDALSAYMSAPPTDAWGAPFTCHAALIGIANDGYPILYTAWMGHPGEWEDFIEDFRVWVYKGGKAVSYDFTADGTYGWDISFGTLNGAGALSVSTSGGGGVEEYDDMMFYTLSNGGLTLADSVRIYNYDAEWLYRGKRYPATYGGSWHDPFLANTLGWTRSTDFTASGSIGTYFCQDITDGSAMYAALDTYAALNSNLTPAEILARIPYFGDRAKCRLTAQQAEQLAAALDNWSAFHNDGWISVDGIFLCDGDGSGLPVLCVASSTHVSSDGWEDSAEMADLYYWQNGELQRESLGPFNGSLGAYYGHEYGRFGKRSDGKYGWTSEYAHSAYMFFSACVIQKGGLTWSDTYTVDTNWGYAGAVVRLDVNDNPIIRYEYDDSLSPEVWDQRAQEVSEKYGELISSYVIRERIDYKVGGDLSTISALLRAYAKADLAPSYPTYTNILGTGWEEAPTAAALAAVPGEVVACYSLTDGMCYVLVKAGDSFQGVLVQARSQRGSISWQAIRTDKEPAEPATLAAAVNDFLGKSNLALDFGKLQEKLDAQALADYLDGLFADVAGKGPNDLAKQDLATFLDGALSASATEAVTGKKNRLALADAIVSALAQKARADQATLVDVLDRNKVTLNKTLTPVVRTVWTDIDPDEPCQVELSPLLVKALDGCDLQILLGSADTYLRLRADDLDALTRALGTLQVQFSREAEHTYAIRFLDAGGNVVEQLSHPVTVALPATGPLNTVMASYASGSDNWGGQYDAANGSISFETRYSGSYEVLENNVAIDDIAGLSEESRAAISFMVSKGYMRADGGLFRPGDGLTRYEFTEALVGMFFALDRSLTCTFPDVDPNGPYYPYVASAQAKSIVNGYSDGTFSGDDPINREQVFALAARTLMDQKGYTPPADFEQYLTTFADRDQISGWAATQVAMAVRDGIAGRGEVLLPQQNITREQAAIVLYRLFQLLYQVSPVALDVPGGGGGSSTVIIAAAVGVAVAAAGGGTAAALTLKKRKKAPPTV